jgi:hypothetical protein
MTPLEFSENGATIRSISVEMSIIVLEGPFDVYSKTIGPSFQLVYVSAWLCSMQSLG